MEVGLRFGNNSAAAFMRFKQFSSPLITNNELSEAVKESLAQTLAQGEGFRVWRKRVNELFDAAGVARLSGANAEFLFCAETSMAFGVNRFVKLQSISDSFPYFTISTCKDERVSESHRAFEGKILSSSDSEYYPPLGESCRCVAMPISKRQAEKQGITGPDFIAKEMRENLQADEFLRNKVKWMQAWMDMDGSE